MRDRDRLPWRAYGGQKTTPSALWVPGIELSYQTCWQAKVIPKFFTCFCCLFAF